MYLCAGIVGTCAVLETKTKGTILRRMVRYRYRTCKSKTFSGVLSLPVPVSSSCHIYKEVTFYVKLTVSMYDFFTPRAVR